MRGFPRSKKHRSFPGDKAIHMSWLCGSGLNASGQLLSFASPLQQKIRTHKHRTIIDNQLLIKRVYRQNVGWPVCVILSRTFRNRTNPQRHGLWREPEKAGGLIFHGVRAWRRFGSGGKIRRILLSQRPRRGGGVKGRNRTDGGFGAQTRLLFERRDSVRDGCFCCCGKYRVESGG